MSTEQKKYLGCLLSIAKLSNIQRAKKKEPEFMNMMQLFFPLKHEFLQNMIIRKDLQKYTLQLTKSHKLTGPFSGT